jgi:hypothetical protein
LEESHILKLRIPSFDNDNIMRVARTFSEKPVFFNKRKLEHPLNKVWHAEYDERMNEIQVVLLSTDKEIRELCDGNRHLYVSASF